MPESRLLQRILDDINDLPPLPQVAAQVMQMTNDPDVSAAELNNVISQDEALTANLLKLCNSSYYGLPRVISSVTQAIMYLGFQTVRNMVLTSTLDRVYADYDLSFYNFEPGGLSRHSFATAIASQVISKKLRPGLRDTAFTAGLLHGVGKIILGKYVREHKNELMEVTDGQFVTREAKIADNWNFPQELILAIGYHPEPELAPGKPLLSVIVYLAQNTCKRLGVGLLGGPIVSPLSDYCAEATGTTEEDMDALLAEVQQNLEATRAPNPDAK
jgi:HD-like signal output (HDOD) protein